MGHIRATGAGSGLGQALTIGLVERGHQVSMMGAVISDCRSRNNCSAAR